jgi:hypothetical protein
MGDFVMSSSLDHKCQRCGSQYHGQVCPFCTITGLDVNALLASEGLTMPTAPSAEQQPSTERAQALLVDVVSNRTFPVSAPVCRFGRDISNDIVLTGDKSLSRFHFQVTLNNGEFYVEDAGSRNGTFLNGSPVTSPRRVLAGDIISAGMSRYRLVGSEDEIHRNGEGGHDLVIEAAAAAAAAQAAPPPEIIAHPTIQIPKPALQHVLDGVLEEEAQAQAQAAVEVESVDTGAHEALTELAIEIQKAAVAPAPEAPAFEAPAPEEQAPEAPVFEAPAPEAPAPQPESTSEHRKPHMPHGNQPVTDPATSNLDALIPTKEDELTDTASRFLKMAQNASENLWPDGVEHPLNDQEAAANAKGKARGSRTWPAWCTEYSFAELDELRDKVKTIEGEIAAKQVELDQLSDTLADAEGMKNRLLATHDDEMVQACSAVLTGLGWQTELNAGTTDELVLSADGTAVAIAKVVCTETQPKPNVLAHLVSSLSNYWSEHGVEPKGILLVAFVADGPLQSRPELGKDLSDYASKKNLCLMNSVQLLAIYRESTLRHADVESMKSEILGASGLLKGFEIEQTTVAAT